MTGLSPQQLFQQALGLHRAGRLAEAEQAYLQLLGVDPANPATNHMLGVLRFQQGRNSEALELIGTALKARPDDARILLNYANVQAALGHTKEALESYDKAVVLKPDYAEAHYNRGITLWGLKRFEEALASYDKALAIKPDYAEAHYNRGIALYDLTRFAEALASYDKALVLKPDYMRALTNRGNALFAINRFEEALVSYDKALQIEPDCADALNGRGNALGNLKRFDEALASFDRALAVEPQHPGGLSGSADMARHLCDWTRTAKIAEEIKAHVASRKSVIAPFILLGYSDDAALQLECAKHYVDHRIPVPPPSLRDGTPRRGGKIRIAYLSSDFRQHPVAFQMAELLERHDRAGDLR